MLKIYFFKIKIVDDKRILFISKTGDAGTFNSIVFKPNGNIPEDNNLQKLMIDYLEISEIEYSNAFKSQ